MELQELPKDVMIVLTARNAIRYFLKINVTGKRRSESAQRRAERVLGKLLVIFDMN